jgi:hypothetical protein
MVNSNVVVPVGVLAGLSVAMFIFIWIWFPRHWRKGVAMDQAIMDEERRQREIGLANLNAQPRGHDGLATPNSSIKPPMPRAYIAAVTPY